MGLSAANILLEVLGDSSSARKELLDVSRDLALFGREEAEAAAYVDTAEASRELDELKARLKKFAADDHSTEVNLQIAKALADLAALQAELKKIDGQDVDVDIDVRRGVIERMGALSRQIGQLGDAMGGGADAASGLGFRLGGLGGSLGTMIPIVVAAVIAVSALVSALAALVASLTQALGGLGALAIAFGATLIPAIAIGVGAILRFKDTADEAGSAANALKTAFGDFGQVFKDATAAGSDALFRGLAAALRDLSPLVDALGPAFTRLGAAGGDAFRLLGEQFSSPAWRQFFVFTTDSLAQLTPLFARSFGAFAKILANIATAAMPFLIQGFRSIAEGLEAIAGNTSNIKGLREGIGGLVDQLSTWLDLTESLGGAFLAFVRAAAPAGQAIAEWIADVADNFKEWANSEEGRARIQAFFKDVLPLIQQALLFLGKVGVIILQITQFFAPLATVAFAALNKVAGAISDVLEWLIEVDRKLAFSNWGGVFEDAWTKIKEIVSAPIDFVIGFAGDIVSKGRDIWDDVKGVVTDGIQFVIKFASDIGRRARDIWQTVKGVITDVVKFVLKVPHDPAGAARDLWRAVKGIIKDAIQFVLTLPGDIAAKARDRWDDVKGIIKDGIEFVITFASGIVARAKEIWSNVKSAVSGAIDLVVKIVPDLGGLPGKVKSALGFARGVRDLWSDMFAMVGESGPELAFLPQGTDIYTAGETRNILSALSKGAAPPAAAAPAAASAGGGGQTVNNYDVKIVAPSGGSPDPEAALALWSSKLRAKGALV